jgi:hypothetical protein
LADAIPNPVLRAVVISMLVLTRRPATIKNLDASEARMRTVAAIMKIGINDISIGAPIVTKKTANMFLSGIVTIFATEALLISATKTPARKKRQY